MSCIDNDKNILRIAKKINKVHILDINNEICINVPNGFLVFCFSRDEKNKKQTYEIQFMYISLVF